MTYRERRKRADVQLIQRDFEELESAFLSDAQKLNKKRQAQMKKRIEKVIPELIEAHQKGDTEEVEGILLSLQMPSSKEWRKLLDKLVLSATHAGILRSHFEILRLRELYEFADVWNILPEGYDYDVVLPEEAREFIRKHAYEVGVITEETVLNRLRKTLERGLDEGFSPKDMQKAVSDTVGTWISPWHAETIARTETGKFYNAGRLARYGDDELNGFVEALQYDAIIDTRTTDFCTHADGMIIAMSNQAKIAEYTPPNHFQCRATWLPVTKYEEWEDDFDTSLVPDKGFDFKSPLPKLLKGKKEPLVQPKKRKTSPALISDPDEIRSLDDADFKKAIGNVDDLGLKLSMIQERAEQMLVREAGLKEKKPEPQFMWFGFNSDAQTGTFEIYDKLVEFHMTQEIREDVEELVRALQGATASDIEDILKRYADKHAGSLAHLDIVAKIRETQRNLKASGMTWDGVPLAEKSTEAQKLLSVKRPPMTANFRNATGLRQAIDDGEAWLLKHIDERLAPRTGIKLRFQYDLDRAYAIGLKGTIHFGRYERNAGVIVHEAGHVMHWNNKAVSDLVGTWFRKRTNDLTMQRTKRMGEPVIADNFFNSYIGRMYGWEDKNGRILGMDMNGQEVLSMGLQAMYENPQKFYEDDRDHFIFTYAILRGLF